MNSSRRKIWWLLGGGLLAALALLAVIVYPEAKKRWTAPLGPELALPSLTPALSSAAGSASTPSSLAGRTGSPTDTGGEQQTLPTQALPTPLKPAVTPQPMCGGPPTMNVLAIGIDRGIDYDYGLSDVIRIVRVDFVTPSVVVFALPRDLWVEIPGIEAHYGITQGKLNQAYFYGTPGMGYYQGPGGGAGLLARTLDLNFGLHVDHYGVVNLGTFTKIVDAVGGIDIDLPAPVDGLPFEGNPIDMGYFPAGPQHLNGEQALRLARIRQKYGDLVRIQNQNRVICALRDKITTPAVLPKIPQIIAALQDSVLTDLTPQQLAQMACLVPELKPEKVLFFSLPQEMLSSGQMYSPQLKGNVYILNADFDLIKAYAGQFMAASGPIETDETSCP
jgi:polyisoprenyl-teichoic acid--peptidoglycan teichoic acid transferase